MPKSRRLTKRQLAVLDDLFTGDSDERAVLNKNRVPRALYEKWLASERFASQFEQQIVRAYRQSRVILARKAPEAAKKLAELANGGKGETARKACLDIIATQYLAGRKTPSDAPSASELSVPAADLSPETASRLLAALAEHT